MLPIEKYTFICGFMHSGTTWINKWLGEHPDVFTGGDDCNVLFNWIHQKNMLISRGWFTEKDINWLWKDPAYIRQQFDQLFSIASCRKNNEPCILYRFTALHRKMHDVSTIFPGSSLLLVHRDGRRVLASHKHRRPRKDLKHVIDQWIEVADKIIQKNYPDNTMILKYADLCENPSVFSRKITEHFGLEHHYDINLNDKVNCSFGEVKPEGYWQQSLSPQDIKMCELMEPQLHALGYKI